MIVNYVADNLPKAGEYPSRSLEKIRGVVLHHTKGIGGPRAIAAGHVLRGWKGIGYPFVIDGGEIFQCQPITAVSNHKWGHNTTRIGIAVVGNYDLVSMSSANLRAVAWVYALTAELLNLRWPSNMVGWGVNRGPVVAGHVELKLMPGQEKTCPGLKVSMDKVREMCRIARNDLRAQGTVNEQLESGVIVPFKRSQ